MLRERFRASEKGFVLYVMDDIIDCSVQGGVLFGLWGTCLSRRPLVAYYGEGKEVSMFRPSIGLPILVRLDDYRSALVIPIGQIIYDVETSC